MSRVEWTRLEGNDVEAVVAMFLNRERMLSTRINPSVGDGGVDILERDGDGTGRDVVYQVKRHCGPLKAATKKSIEDGLKRLMGPQSPGDKVKRDSRWEALHVSEWHLVLPWDPTPEALTWLDGLGRTYGVRAVWDGLTKVDQLAAKYPDIIDYYLHGGRERVAAGYRELGACFAATNLDPALDARSVSERLKAALAILDHDPHYRYEHRFGEGPLPPLGERPNLVFSHVIQDSGSGQWSIIDVIARCAASTDARPITLSGTLKVDPDSDDAQTFADFFAYGTPFATPTGAYTGEFDAPGGLGGPVENASIAVQAIPDVGDAPALHLQALDPDGLVLAEVDLDRVERTQGQVGLRVVLKEANGVFSFEDRYNPADQTGTRTLRFGNTVGKPVTPVAKAYRFLLCCQPPNTGRLSVRHAPPERGTLDPNIGLLDDDERRTAVERISWIMDLLDTIQQHDGAQRFSPELLTEVPQVARSG